MNYQEWFRLALAILATWRITHLLAAEDGPADIVVRLRQSLGNSFLGKLMDCFYCLSLWIAAPLAWLLINRWQDWPMTWIALSGAACLLERWTERTGQSPEPHQLPTGK